MLKKIKKKQLVISTLNYAYSDRWLTVSNDQADEQFVAWKKGVAKGLQLPAFYAGEFPWLQRWTTTLFGVRRSKRRH